MTNRALRIENLGDKGQARFAELCADAGLIFNPAHQDRAGSDFLVDFPQERSPLTSFDQRPPPLAVHVQVKTRWATTHRIQMKLSAAERLAKEVKPAFVAVFDVADDRRFVGARLIHVDGPFLESILTRLREAERDGVTGLNRKTISFEPERYGKGFDLTGAGLRRAIEAAVGSDLPTYVGAKRRKLETLGYGPDRLTMKTRLLFSNEAELIDAYLGLGEVEAEDIRALENRFDIELPLPRSPDMMSGKLTFLPTGEENCEVVVRNGIASPLRFGGEMLGPPGEIITTENWKFRVITRFFELHLTPGNFRWAGRPDAMKTPAPFSEVWALAKMLEASTFATSTIEVRHRTNGTLSGTSEAMMPDDPQVAQRRAIGRLFDRTKGVLDKLGLPNHEVSFERVLSEGKAISMAEAWLHDPTRLSPWSFTVKTPAATGPAPVAPTAMMTCILEVLDLQVAIAAVAEMDVTQDGETQRWTSRSLEPVAIQTVTDPTKDFPRFVEDAKRTTGIRDLVVGL